MKNIKLVFRAPNDRVFSDQPGHCSLLYGIRGLTDGLCPLIMAEKDRKTEGGIERPGQCSRLLRFREQKDGVRYGAGTQSSNMGILRPEKRSEFMSNQDSVLSFKSI